jgi:tetratricopeptide (TPR) repeat protein
MDTIIIKRGLIVIAAIVCVLQLAGCAAQRIAGWEREQVKVEGDAAQLINEANTHWAQRQDMSHLEKALELYEQAAAIDQQNLELLITLARGYYFLADAYLQEDKEHQTEIYDTSLAYAEKAMALEPEFKKLVDDGKKVEDAIRVLDKQYVGAIYWGSASLGKWGLNKGLATILANKERGRKMMARCVELDETYFYGGPHRWFGGYYAKLPSIAGRDLDKSKEHFEKSLKIAPNYFGTRILRSEHYALNAQDKELYQSDLEFVLNTPADVIPELVPEQEVEKKKAAEMLEEIEDRFL